jgi:hypothetical protein
MDSSGTSSILRRHARVDSGLPSGRSRSGKGPDYETSAVERLATRLTMYLTFVIG